MTDTPAPQMPVLGFWKMANDAPDQLALVDAAGVETTRGELLAAANQVVHGLRALGFAPGDVVAIALPNSREVYEVFMAAAQAGWYVTPVNWHLAAPEIAYILEDCGAKASSPPSVSRPRPSPPPIWPACRRPAASRSGTSTASGPTRPSAPTSRRPPQPTASPAAR